MIICLLTEWEGRTGKYLALCQGARTSLRSVRAPCPRAKYFPVRLSHSVNNNFLLTKREGRTGEYWPEIVAVRTERSEVRAKTIEGQYSPVRLELARLVSSMLYGFLITFCFVFASP